MANGNLLDNSLVIYGSPMGDSNVHNHKRCPLFLAGHLGGTAQGRTASEGRGRYADGQRDADAAAWPGSQTTSRRSAISTGEFDLNNAGATTTIA